MAENMSRAQYLLNIIEQMDVEAEPQYALNKATGYTYQNRGQKGDSSQYSDGKRPAGLMSRAGKSS